jgi:hypothetical protein
MHACLERASAAIVTCTMMNQAGWNLFAERFQCWLSGLSDKSSGPSENGGFCRAPLKNGRICSTAVKDGVILEICC